MSGPINPFEALAAELQIKPGNLEAIIRRLGLTLTHDAQEAAHAEWMRKFGEGTLSERKIVGPSVEL